MTARIKYRFGPGLSRAGLRWTDDEIATLAALYRDTPIKDISAKMQRTAKSLRLKVEELQLRRSPEFVGVIRSEVGMKGYVARLRKAEAGRAVRGELVEVLFAQMTRAGLPPDQDKERELIASWSVQAIKAKTEQYRQLADRQLSPGRVSDPADSLASRHGDTDAAQPAPPRAARV